MVRMRQHHQNLLAEGNDMAVQQRFGQLGLGEAGLTASTLARIVQTGSSYFPEPNTIRAGTACGSEQTPPQHSHPINTTNGVSLSRNSPLCAESCERGARCPISQPCYEQHCVPEDAACTKSDCGQGDCQDESCVLKACEDISCPQAIISCYDAACSQIGPLDFYNNAQCFPQASPLQSCAQTQYGPQFSFDNNVINQGPQQSAPSQDFIDPPWIVNNLHPFEGFDVNPFCAHPTCEPHDFALYHDSGGMYWGIGNQTFEGFDLGSLPFVEGTTYMNPFMAAPGVPEHLPKEIQTCTKSAPHLHRVRGPSCKIHKSLASKVPPRSQKGTGNVGRGAAMAVQSTTSRKRVRQNGEAFLSEPSKRLSQDSMDSNLEAYTAGNSLLESDEPNSSALARPVASKSSEVPSFPPIRSEASSPENRDEICSARTPNTVTSEPLHRQQCSAAATHVCKWNISNDPTLRIPCDRAFLTPRELHEHTDSEHVQPLLVGPRAFICRWTSCKAYAHDYCTRTKLQRHLLSHSGYRQHACPECNKKFTTADQLKNHGNSCLQQRPYLCEHCGKRSSTMTQHKTHMRTHTRDKPFKCGVDGCTYETGDSSNMAKHKKHRHRDLTRRVEAGQKAANEA